MATDTHKGLRLRAAVIPPLAKAEGSPDRFFMEDPHFGGMIKEAQAEGKAEGKAEDLASSKKTLLRFIEEHFPALGVRATHNALLPENRDELDLLIIKVATASNEEAVRGLLGLPAD